MKLFIKYAVHIAFATVLGYFALLAFVLEQEPMTNKMLMLLTLGFWALWIFAKSLLKMIAAVLLIGALAFAGYYIIHAEEIECKKAGREWNKTLQICEDKKTMGEKIKGALSGMVKTTFKKWKDDNIKIEKTEDDAKTRENKKQ